MNRNLSLALFFISTSTPAAHSENYSRTKQMDISYAESLATLKNKPSADEVKTVLSTLMVDAQNGHHPSELLLAKIFYLGSGLFPRDFDKALPYVKAAALRNNPWAMNAFASMCEFGQGMERSESLAISWYRLAATHGHPRAMANLGRILTSRPALSQAHIEGCAWLYLSSELNDGVGKRTLIELEAGIPAENTPKIQSLLNELRQQIRQEKPVAPAADRK